MKHMCIRRLSKGNFYHFSPFALSFVTWMLLSSKPPHKLCAWFGWILCIFIAVFLPISMDPWCVCMCDQNVCFVLGDDHVFSNNRCIALFFLHFIFTCWDFFPRQWDLSWFLKNLYLTHIHKIIDNTIRYKNGDRTLEHKPSWN